MSFGLVTTFDDPDRYQATVRGGDCEVLLNDGGDFKVELTRIDFESLWMQRGRSFTRSHITHVGLDPKRAVVLFRSDTGRVPMHHNGFDLSPAQLVVHSRGDAIHNWSPGANQWLAMSMPHAALAAAAHAMRGHEMEAPPTTFVTRCAEAAMTQLRTVHNAACDLAGTNPSALSHPATAKALEQQLVGLLVNCLPERVPTAAKANRGSRAKVVSRFRDFLASRQYQPAYVAEICAAIGVSESSLRHCCQEQLGMGPIHYLWLRRMQLARRALLAGAGAKTVTDVATEYGFWELGRFSVQYRALFGESPSATLKRSRWETPGSRER